MKDKKFSVLIYYIGVGLGFLSGACFSRAQYHKGKRDAYIEQLNFLDELIEPMEKTLNALKAEQEES